MEWSETHIVIQIRNYWSLPATRDASTWKTRPKSININKSSFRTQLHTNYTFHMHMMRFKCCNLTSQFIWIGTYRFSCVVSIPSKSFENASNSHTQNIWKLRWLHTIFLCVNIVRYLYALNVVFSFYELYRYIVKYCDWNKQ